MPVPDFQSLMLPVLQAIAPAVITSSDLRSRVALSLGLNEADLEELLPSGRQTVFANRVAWANIFLHRAGLVRRVRRGAYEITEEGRSVLSQNPSRIDMRYLDKYESYRVWRASSIGKSDGADALASLPSELDVEGAHQTPEELIESAHKSLDSQLCLDLLERLYEVPPATFEQIIIDLLLKMGYGGGRKEMGQALGRSGDGGVDGFINEDELGLDVVYMQAKRYAALNTVGEPEVRNFVGALVGRRASKGVFVTTSKFSRSAIDFAAMVPNRIILIDGSKLASLMVAHDVGVRVKATYRVRAVDEEFFGD